MSVTIPDEILHSARMSEAELNQEIAVMLYQEEVISFFQEKNH